MKGLIEAIDAENLKSEVPEFNVGDTVKVGYKIIEGGKERVQNFEGVVIAKKNGGIQESFTVRHISYGIGVEKTYPLHSPKIAAITVVRKGKVRRAKLYYLRDLTGKAAKFLRSSCSFLPIHSVLFLNFQASNFSFLSSASKFSSCPLPKFIFPSFLKPFLGQNQVPSKISFLKNS